MLGYVDGAVWKERSLCARVEVNFQLIGSDIGKVLTRLRSAQGVDARRSWRHACRGRNERRLAAWWFVRTFRSLVAARLVLARH